MANVVIDPVIVMTPPDEADETAVKIWLDNLATWLKEALTAPFSWLYCKRALELLVAHGQFPGFLHLRNLQRKYRLDINIIQIDRDINTFFRDDDELSLEKHLQRIQCEVEPETDSIMVEPEQFITRLPEYIHHDMHMLLANCCAYKHIGDSFVQKLHIATIDLQDGSKEITVSATILDALPDFVRPIDNKITQSFPLLITPDDLYPLIDVISLWAKGEQGIVYAIQQECGKRWFDAALVRFEFRLGVHFISSVNERGLDTNEIVLRNIIRAASDVIVDKAKDVSGYRLHQFRESETADSPQLVRDSDQARAWRLMIQRRGAGWRLHYWQVPTSEGYIIEFANVCKESEREIY